MYTGIGIGNEYIYIDANTVTDTYMYNIHTRSDILLTHIFIYLFPVRFGYIYIYAYIVYTDVN